jgi:hypothetical protein
LQEAVPELDVLRCVECSRVIDMPAWPSRHAPKVGDRLRIDLPVDHSASTPGGDLCGTIRELHSDMWIIELEPRGPENRAARFAAGERFQVNAAENVVKRIEPFGGEEIPIRAVEWWTPAQSRNRPQRR